MEDERVQGLLLSEWSAAFHPGMPEFAASRFAFTQETAEQVRIAFGNHGPIVDPSGKRLPVFTHAVTLPPHVAVDLAHLLLKHYASPFGRQPEASAAD